MLELEGKVYLTVGDDRFELEDELVLDFLGKAIVKVLEEYLEEDKE